MTSQIPGWRTASTFEPRLVVTTATPGPVLAAMRVELERVGYKVIDATSTYVRLRYTDWFAMAAQDWSRTVVGLTARPDQVLVEVEAGSSKRKASVKAQDALNAAVSALRQQGVDLTVGPWHKVP